MGILGYSILVLSLAIAPALAGEAPNYSYSDKAKFVAGAVRQIGNGITAQGLMISSPTGNAIVAEIIDGSATVPHPGILFVHWLGSPKTTNRSEFEPDAVALARKGMTSLLIDAAWSIPNWFDGVGKSAAADTAMTRKQVIDLRCALDLLIAHKGVDGNRVAYVGHDFGAMFGALLAGADARPHAFVLMAGTPLLADWYRFQKKLPNEEHYRAAIAPYDTLAGLRASNAKAFLFQFSKHDDYIPRERAQAFADAAPQPKTIVFYDADHGLAVPRAAADRQAWLIKQLK
jgi:pimeloyl-ACP methyl ester carboxylesterase